MSKRLELRLEPDELAKLDEWRKGQPDLPARATAARRIINIVTGKKESRRAAAQ